MSAFMLVLAAVVADDDTSKKDLEAWQGTWKVERFIIDGTALPPEVNKRHWVVVTGDKMMLRGNEHEKSDATIKLDPSKKPAAIDMTEKGTVVEGIYEVKGDSAKLCWAPRKARPKDFTAEKGSEAILMVLKREKK